MNRVSKRLRNYNGRVDRFVWPDHLRENIVIALFQNREVEDDIFLKGAFEVGFGEIKLIVRKIHGCFNGQVHLVWITGFRNLRAKN